jgi:hypothetical protein
VDGGSISNEEVRMKMLAFPAKNSVWLVLVCGVVLGALALPHGALAADRVVLAEYFNATW